VAALGERLHLWLPEMSKAGVPLYLTESTLVLRYSRKPKDAKLIELIAETVEATTVSPPMKGFLRQGFLGATSAVLIFSPKPEGVEFSINFNASEFVLARIKARGPLL
jgi:hypothetical protein